MSIEPMGMLTSNYESRPAAVCGSGRLAVMFTTPALVNSLTST